MLSIILVWAVGRQWTEFSGLGEAGTQNTWDTKSQKIFETVCEDEVRREGRVMLGPKIHSWNNSLKQTEKY